MNENKFMAMLLGECWHEVVWKDEQILTSSSGYGYLMCEKCGKTWHEKDETNKRPIYHDSKDRMTLETTDKIMNKMPRVWENYLMDSFLCTDTRHFSSGLYTDVLNNQLYLSNFLDYLKTHKEEWAYIVNPAYTEVLRELEEGK
jgi:hypothetical protein